MMYDINKLPGSLRAQIYASGIPFKTIGWEFSDLESTPAAEAVKKWVASVVAGKVIRSAGEPSCGVGLALVGEPGHGKTTLASVALQELLKAMPRDAWGMPGTNHPFPVAFMDYPRLLRLQKAQWSGEDEDVQDLIDGIYGDGEKHLTVQVFVLDDLGKEYKTASGWAENTFDALLRSRFNAGLPTIVTTNVPIKKWGTVYGEPMGSFVHEAFMPVVVKSDEGDRRIKL
jgi:DNA replication protein DnaC